MFETRKEFLPIDAIGIKLRAIHTGVFSEELVFLMDGDHAGTVHSGGIDHHRVETCNRFHSIRPGQFTDRAHHQRWSDCNNFTDSRTKGIRLFEHRFKGLGDEPMQAKTTIVTGINHFQIQKIGLDTVKTLSRFMPKGLGSGFGILKSTPSGCPIPDVP